MGFSDCMRRVARQKSKIGELGRRFYELLVFSFISQDLRIIILKSELPCLFLDTEKKRWNLKMEQASTVRR